MRKIWNEKFTCRKTLKIIDTVGIISSFPSIVPAILTFIVLLYLSMYSSPLFAQEIRHPNVIIIYTDDQGTIDANCYGAKDLHTPNIDMLAETGIRFTQFYAAASVCSPSRAA